MTWPTSHRRRAELRAERFRDIGGTRAEYLDAAAAAVRDSADEHGWSSADIARELAVHLQAASKVWEPDNATACAASAETL